MPAHACPGAEFGNPEGRVSYEPNHPLADDNGMVRRADLDLTDQMVYMQLAQRGYQANVATFEHAKERLRDDPLDRTLTDHGHPLDLPHLRHRPARRRAT